MGYIFEDEIERIMHTVRARTIGEADSITLREILLASIHPAIKAYFKAEVQRQLLEERQLEVRSKRFPYAIPEVAGLQRQMDLLLLVNYQFDQHEFETLLDQAVHFTFNFLCRPQFTFVEFLFENQRQQSTQRIEQKLEYCVDYEYFSLLLKRYFTERGLASISYEEFKKLLAKIDQEVISEHSSIELANMTKPIMGFVEAIQDQPPAEGKAKTLPINAAIVFFEDKNLSELKLRLEYERDHSHLMEIDLQRLADIIEEVRAITSGRQTASVVEETVPSPPPPAEQQQVIITINRASGDETRVEQAADARPMEPNNTTSGLAEKQLEEPGLPLLQAKASVALADILSLMSGSEKKKIAKAIFHKDQDEFVSTVALLEKAGSWEEASLVLDDLFLAKGVDPQSRVAILLTEKVYQRFHPAAE
jgi:hypothetical protein